jgi:hypothetical protein
MGLATYQTGTLPNPKDKFSKNLQISERHFRAFVINDFYAHVFFAGNLTLDTIPLIEVMLSGNSSIT